MGRNYNNWTPGTLKSRGWTERLIAQLLPKPRYVPINGRRVRVWPRAVVCEAEQRPEFQAARQRSRSAAADAPLTADDALANALALLREAGKPLAAGTTPEYLLAQRYHEAICRRIPQTGWAERRKPRQDVNQIHEFLSLGRGRPVRSAAATLRNLAACAIYIARNASAPQVQELLQNYAQTLLAAAGAELRAFRAGQAEADATALLTMPNFPADELLSHPLGYLYSVHFVPQAIRSSLAVLVALNPKDEYPRARAMQRHFVLHVGGTNTGKTYAGFERLKQAPSGIYLAPLRLLALEAQELLLDAGVACSLTTGEEEDCDPADTHVAATAEKLDLRRQYDVAVIDECQMIADPARGYAWTRAILGILAPEIHLCAAPEAKGILVQLIRSCGDTFEVVTHRRKTPLICMRRQIDYGGLQPGDALITFSKIGVLSLAEDLRRQGRQPAIIYGALPYATRRRQVEGFLRGEMQYIVSTDAIGMGLNLPIRRIIFAETEKFDGQARRDLRPEEIQQISGRAGRYGMYDRGYVGAMQNLSQVRMALETVIPPIQHAVIGFSDLVLNVEFDLLEVLDQWNRMPTVKPYVKLDISRYLRIITMLREAGFRLDKEQELRAANIPFDETDPELLGLFRQFLHTWHDGREPQQPQLDPARTAQYTLPELELHCRKLDLYFSFAKAFGCAVDADALYDERELAAEQINRILLHNLKNNIRFCAQCGTALPLHHNGRLCRACFEKQRGQRRNKH